MKSQVFQNELMKAMFEAFARNKYKSSGIIFWMYNSAWPTLFWQLYDYYLTPNGSFYAARKACEPLHIQFAYDDSAVYVVNGFHRPFNRLTARATLYNINMEQKFSAESTMDISPDESTKAINIDWPNDASPVYYLKLTLRDQNDSLMSENFYWLSTKGDTDADFTALNELPVVELNSEISVMNRDDNLYRLSLKIENLSGNLAFAVNPKIKKGKSGDLVLPVFWDDNYFSLLPGETRNVAVEFNPADLGGADPYLEVEGWNVKTVKREIK
jgi:exo-1,4-beta-D-glucosaminidase